MTPIKILLAEDDGDDQIFFYDFLSDRQDLILLPMVTNGVELLEYLKKNKTNNAAIPDAIVLDQNMPKMTGLQTLEILKNDRQYAHIKVMIYSTYTDENLIKQSMHLGATTVALKPEDHKGYHKMIDEFLRLK